jgi:hypothetical protein
MFLARFDQPIDWEHDIVSHWHHLGARCDCSGFTDIYGIRAGIFRGFFAGGEISRFSERNAGKVSISL